MTDALLDARTGLAVDRVAHAAAVAGRPPSAPAPATSAGRLPSTPAELLDLAAASLHVLFAERGRRLVTLGLLADADDARWLTLAELRDPPADAATRVATRRASNPVGAPGR
jgi:hypothetical protein